jgi:D-alanine-D-alanine ligase
MLTSAVDTAFKYDDCVLCEKFIEGHELTVAVMKNIAFPPVLILPHEGFYDYEHKYTSGKTEYICPAPFDPDILSRLSDSAIKAFNALGCKCYARVDFRLTPDYRFYCLEVNTLPGMTDLSLVPKAAKAAGIGFGELLTRICEDALK